MLTGSSSAWLAKHKYGSRVNNNICLAWIISLLIIQLDSHLGSVGSRPEDKTWAAPNSAYTNAQLNHLPRFLATSMHWQSFNIAHVTLVISDKAWPVWQRQWHFDPSHCLQKIFFSITDANIKKPNEIHKTIGLQTYIHVDKLEIQKLFINNCF